MKLIFVGPQGSGKGTQAKIISSKLGIAHLSTGDMMRGAAGELKKELEGYMSAGKLVPDELVLKILKERLMKDDCKKGFILDGFPRNIAQAKALQKITKIDEVVDIEITDGEAVKRALGRVTCPKCGEGFNTVTNPPKKENTCDKCGTIGLTRRKDDNEEAMKKRLEIYHSETEPLLSYYQTLKIEGNQPIENVTADILAALGK